MLICFHVILPYTIDLNADDDEKDTKSSASLAYAVAHTAPSPKEQCTDVQNPRFSSGHTVATQWPLSGHSVATRKNVYKRRNAASTRTHTYTRF